MLKKNKLSIVVFFLILIFWQFVVVVANISPILLPKPTDIISALIENLQILSIHFLYTLTEAVVGIVLAIIVGVGSGVALFNMPVVQKIVIPYVNVLQMIPGIVIAPLFALWFGFGFFPKILLIIIFCSFPILITTLNSFKLVNHDSLMYLKSLNASPYQLYRYLYLPSSLPQIFASIKIATTYALINAIFAEYMGAKYGLGVYLNRAAASFATVDVFAVIVVIVFTTLGLLKIVDILEKRIIKWR